MSQLRTRDKNSNDAAYQTRHSEVLRADGVPRLRQRLLINDGLQAEIYDLQGSQGGLELAYCL